MSLTLTIQDKNVGGGIGNEFSLKVMREKLTVKELIKARVYQEVTEFNAQLKNKGTSNFKGLVKPESNSSAPVDYEEQTSVAINAFNSNQIIILIDDKQAESIDEQIELHDESIVSFLKLTQLVGG